MYNDYFGLTESPFSIAPDPRYLYMSEQHREALAHLIYGFNGNGGFVLLTGEVGTGKTTICRCLLEQIPGKTEIAFILNPKLTVNELLATICDEFGIDYPEGTGSIKVFVDLLNTHLLSSHEQGHKAVLLIDEAQNLEPDVLEQLRLLTNLETNREKLLQIMLIGQPELRDKLAAPELRQLSQRIIARYHLDSIAEKEVDAYISHRLAVAGIQDTLFPQSTIRRIYSLSHGIPRLINVICDRALLGTFTEDRNTVSPAMVKTAAAEVLGSQTPGRAESMRRSTVWVLVVISVIVFGAALSATYYRSGVPVPVAEVPPKDDQSPALEYDELEWPGSAPLNKSRESAYQKLFSLWELPYSSTGSSDPCREAEKNGLRCYKGVGTLDMLANLDRPAVLHITDRNQNSFYAALTSLEAQALTIHAGDRAFTIEPNSLSNVWLGEFTLLWRPHPEHRDELRLGDSGPHVAWLSGQLSRAQGMEPSVSDTASFDDAMLRRVKEFQIASGLIPDGIAGTQTMMHLLSADSNSRHPGIIPKEGVQ